jgi:hypothetical protein
MTATHDFDRRIGEWLQEGAQTIPEWLVEQALDQAHATPQLRPGIRLPWTTRPVSGVRRAVVLALILATLLAIAVGVGSSRRAEEPTRVPAPGFGCWSQERSPALPIRDPLAVPDSDIRVHVAATPEMLSTAQGRSGVIGLGDGVPGLSYGYEVVGSAVYLSTTARGIVIADVTRATSHAPATGGLLVGRDPASFVAGLRYVVGLAVSEPEVIQFADRPAVSASVSAGAASGWKHIDRKNRLTGPDCVVDFTLTSSVRVVDVDGLLVLVQIWAANEEGLRAWLPTATVLLETVRLSRQ